MKIGTEENFIELEIQLDCRNGLPSDGDALIGIVVSSNDFCGKNQVWVAESKLDVFGRAILELEKYRKGEAILTSISPGELYLRVYAYTGFGHIAIEGETGYCVAGPVGFFHSVKFGFAIESEQLVKMSKIKWQL